MSTAGNPFASSDEPSAPPPPPPGEGPGLPPVELELEPVLRRVAQHLSDHLLPTAAVAGTLLVLTLVGLPLGMVVGVLSSVAVLALGLPDVVVNVVSNLTGVIQGMLSTIVVVFAYRAFFDLARDGEVRLDALPGEGISVLKLWLANALVLLVFMVFLAPAWAAGAAWHYGHLPPMEALAVGGANLALLFPVSMVVGVFTQFLGVILVDQRIGPLAALRECVRITEGARLLAAGLLVVLGFLGGLVGVLTCGFGTPLFQVAFAWCHVVMYRGMLARHGRAAGSQVSGPL